MQEEVYHRAKGWREGSSQEAGHHNKHLPHSQTIARGSVFVSAVSDMQAGEPLQCNSEPPLYRLLAPKPGQASQAPCGILSPSAQLSIWTAPVGCTLLWSRGGPCQERLVTLVEPVLGEQETFQGKVHPLPFSADL